MGKKIVIEMTKEQMEQLAPLFEEAREKPYAGAILGQIHDGDLWTHGLGAFQFVTPKEMRATLRRAEADAKDKTIKPAKP